MKLSNDLITEIKQYDFISKDDLLVVLRKHYSSVSRSYAYRIISSLLNEGYLYKIDSSSFVTNTKITFDYDLSLKDLSNHINTYGDYLIYDSNILNRWINHLLGAVITFIEVDKDLMSLVYDELKAKGYNHILLNPSINEFHKYFDNELIIIRPLTKAYIESNHKISIERVIIQLFSDKILSTLYGDNELNNTLNEIFKTYNVNFGKLYHFARRKKIYSKLHDYLHNNVDLDN